MRKIEGIVEDIVYRNEENGYTVMTVIAGDEEVTLVGLMFGITVGENIVAEGEMAAHNVYGEQLQVSHIETSIPSELAAIERYLGSGAIKGIGPSLAKKVVEEFGEDAFFVIENQPDQLSKVKGISVKKAQAIAEVFYDQRTMRQAIIFLQEYGLSLTYAIKIYNQYKERTYDIVKKNPYVLAEEIQGISFRMADEIAERMGIDKTSEFRMMAAIKHVLYRSTMNGHTYMDEEELKRSTYELLMVQIEDFQRIFMELQIKGSIVIEEMNGISCVFLSSYDMMEKFIAAKLFELTHVSLGSYVSDDKDVVRVSKEMGIDFDERQAEAVSQSMSCGTIVITGGPGTGKTTTLNAIITLFEERGQQVLLAAPTGRAAKRMSEATGQEARTIHRLLEISGGVEGGHSFERNEDYPLEADVIIIDEISMIDTVLMYHLLKAIVPGTRLILVGDKDQLPSVGPGNVLKDIISSGYIHTIKLQRIFRQAGESHIVVNAHKINSGEMIDLKNNQSDFFFIKRLEAQSVIAEVTTMIKTRLPKFAGLKDYEGIQVLTPTRKGTLGVDNLNLVLQKALNPSHKDKTEKVYRDRLFREGDKVMQIKNNYNLSWRIMSQYGFTVDEGIGVFNGDMGKIEEINLFTEKVKVIFDDDRMVYYDFSGLDELDLAYAVTIHKSQGSEYPIVIMPMFKGPTMLLNRNLLYTGITRAKRYVVLVGDDHVVGQMIRNNRETERNSGLMVRIQEVFSVK